MMLWHGVGQFSKNMLDPFYGALREVCKRSWGLEPQGPDSTAQAVWTLVCAWLLCLIGPRVSGLYP